MANKRTFEIAFVGLKLGFHEFNYELNDQFFVEKGAEDFANPNANVLLTLEKNAGFMLLKFEIGGNADVSCDRCGNQITLSLWDEFKILVKQVDNPDEMNDQEEDPDIYYISKNDSHLSVENWIYEFVLLSLPIQKMCTNEEVGGIKCNKEVLEKLKQMEDNFARENATNLWKGLEKFKNN